MSEPFRLAPRLGAESYKTYQVTSPVSTHWRPATCADVDCEQFREGWRVRVEGLTPDLLHAARNSGRRFRDVAVAAGETWLVFEAGQPCFKAAEHKLRNARPEIYLVKGGDWRGNPRGDGGRRHANANDWVEDFAEHQLRLADDINKG